MGTTRTLVALLVLALAQQTPTFRGGVSLVTIDVTVLDADGRPVPGLTAADFEIKINGTPQPVRAVAFVQASAPSTAPAAANPAGAAAAIASTPTPLGPETPRRTFSNAGAPAETAAAPAVAAPGPAAAPAETRVFIILVDDLSFAPNRGKALTTAAQRFIDRVPASDPIGFTTTTGIGALNPTLDRAAVRAALSKVMGQFNDPRNIGSRGPGGGQFTGPDAPLGISESLDIARGDSSMLKEAIIRECFNGDRSKGNSQSLEELIASNFCASEVQREARQVAGITRQNRGRQIAGLTSLIRALKRAGGIRHVVMLSDGLPVSREVDELTPLVRAAAEAGVQLSVLLEEPDVNANDEGRREAPVNPGGNNQTDTGQSRRRRDDDALLVSGLQTMTEMLGGNFHRIIGTPDPFFERVLTSSSAVYRLGVELPAGAKPGDAYAVIASVSRPGLRARANRVAVAAAPAPAPTAPAPRATPSPTAPSAPQSIDDMLKAAISSNTPAGDVPIRIASYVRRSANVAGQVDVSVEVAIPAGVAGPLTTSLGVVDASGALRSSRRVLHASEDGSYTTSFLFPLPPGDYRVRFAAVDAGRALGAVEIPVRAALAPIGNFTAGDVLTWYVDSYSNTAQLFALDEIPPAVTALRASLELHPDGAAGEPPVVRWTLTREGEKAPAQEVDLPADRKGDGFRADVEFPLAELPGGRYVLRAALMVDGRDVGSRAAMVRR